MENLSKHPYLLSKLTVKQGTSSDSVTQVKSLLEPTRESSREFFEEFQNPNRSKILIDEEVELDQPFRSKYISIIMH